METIRISAGLLDREDLDIYAKMCCILLAQAAQEEREAPLRLEDLASKMGCTLRTAGNALDKLIKKGLLIEEPDLELTELKEEARRVRKKDKQSPTARFEEFDAAPKRSISQQLEILRSFIHEPATDGALRIILNMAEGNIDRIRSAYQNAADMQISDTLEATMNILQHGETPPIQPAGVPETEAEKAEIPVVELEPETRNVINQINKKRIAELYGQNKKNATK